MAKEEIKAAMEKHALSVKAEFVPFAQSRNAKDEKTGKAKPVNERSLNWRVTLQKAGRDILTTDYSAGIAHCPSYKQMARWTLDYSRAIEFETDTGHSAKQGFGSTIAKGKPLLPDSCDVVWSLVLDSDVLNYSRFEDWADNLGFDPDSRKAESIYRACLEIALSLRNGLGESVFSELQTAGEDY